MFGKVVVDLDLTTLTAADRAVVAAAPEPDGVTDLSFPVL